MSPFSKTLSLNYVAHQGRGRSFGNKILVPTLRQRLSSFLRGASGCTPLPGQQGSNDCHSRLTGGTTEWSPAAARAFLPWGSFHPMPFHPSTDCNHPNYLLGGGKDVSVSSEMSHLICRPRLNLRYFRGPLKHPKERF